MRFSGSTVLVTGASRGLGRAIATAFGREGAFVYVGFRTGEAAARETLAGIVSAGGEGSVLGFDVTDANAVDMAIDSILAARGKIDVLVNNAGVARDELFAMMQRESWREVIAANLDGTFNVCRAVTRPMLGKKRGAIVNVASVAAVRASPGQVNYAASKGGVLAMTQTLAAELGPRGVRVNAVVPGLIDAGMVTKMDRRFIEPRLAHLPLRRLGTAEDVAGAVLFLASDDASYIVGQALAVDGGLTL
ncbi:MAG: SDR family NAD(P)-dependent oxidoreductase [Archangium sp.]